MKTYYSRSTRGFYVDGVHAEMPADVVAVSAKSHRELIEQQSAGKRIIADARGRPVAADQAEPSNGELATLARRKRDRLIAASDYRVMPDYPQTEAGRDRWMAYRQSLRDVPTQQGFPSDIEWPHTPV